MFSVTSEEVGMSGSQLMRSSKLGTFASQAVAPAMIFRDQLPGCNDNPPVIVQMSHQGRPLPHVRDAPADVINAKEVQVEKVPLTMPARYARVIVAAAQRCKLPVSEVIGPSTRPRCVFPRQLVCYIFVVEMRVSLPRSGKWLGNRHHTTVLHAVRKIAGRIGYYEFVIDEICVAAGV